jgi:hypothetical protein
MRKTSDFLRFSRISSDLNPHEGPELVEGRFPPNKRSSAKDLLENERPIENRSQELPFIPTFAAHPSPTSPITPYPSPSTHPSLLTLHGAERQV